MVVSSAGTGPTPGSVPRSPRLKLRSRGNRVYASVNPTCGEGNRLVLAARTWASAFSISTTAFLTARLDWSARLTASSSRSRSPEPPVDWDQALTGRVSSTTHTTSQIIDALPDLGE